MSDKFFNYIDNIPCRFICKRYWESRPRQCGKLRTNDTNVSTVSCRECGAEVASCVCHSDFQSLQRWLGAIKQVFPYELATNNHRVI